VKRNLFVFFTVALSFLFVISCEKIDTTDIGDDLIPAVDNVHTFDTILEVISDNFLLPDSTRVLNSEAHAWGVIENDPEFGKTKGDFYFSLTPSRYGTHPFPQKDSTLIIDSVVLALAYVGAFGDTSTSLQRMSVFEIDYDANFKDSVIGYPINTVIPYDPTVLGSKLVDFTTLDDSVKDVRKRDTLRLKNQLRIQLDKNLANRFLAYDTSNAYKNDSTFRTLFKGLAIRVDEAGSPGKNALAYFLPSGVNTKLIFYYRVQSSTSSAIVDTVSTEFAFYQFNFANANVLSRTPANNYLTYLNNGNTNDDKVYIQSSPGSYATLRIPNLNTLSNRIIHRAELLVESISNDPLEKFGKPGTLFLDAIDTANKRIITIPYDFTYGNDFETIFGGPIKYNKYNFNLSRYVQSIVTRHENDYNLRLYAPFRTNSTEVRGGVSITPSPPGENSGFPINSPLAYGRVILAGGSYADQTKKIRLRIIYSKI